MRSQPEPPPNMKTKLTLFAALYCGLSAVGSAFTLDFRNYSTGVPIPTGTTVQPALVINVPGYGNVQFDAVGTSVLVVNGDYENDSPGNTTSPSLNFDIGEAVKVTFLGAQPVDVVWATVGLNTGEYFITQEGSTAKEFIVTLGGSNPNAANRGAGLYEVGFQQVPEPSAALLGVLGASMLVLRRKR